MPTDSSSLFYVVDRLCCFLESYSARCFESVLLFYLWWKCYVLNQDFIFFVKSEDALHIQLGGMSGNMIRGLSYLYTTWFAHLELEAIQRSSDRYSTNIEYSRVGSSTKSSSVLARFLQLIMTSCVDGNLIT